MKIQCCLIPALTLLLAIYTQNILAEELFIAAEQYPPYVYQNGRGIEGFSAEVVKRTIRETGLKYEIKIYPFARSKLLAEKNHPIIAFPVVKSPQRDKTFDWLGKIAEDQLHLFKLRKRKDLDFQTINKATPYSISAVRGGIIENYLKEKSFEKFIPVTNIEQGINMLAIGHTDLLATTQLTLDYFAHKLGLSEEEIVPVLALEELSIEAHLAASKSVPEATKEKFRKALNELHHSGDFLKIKQAFLSSEK